MRALHVPRVDMKAFMSYFEGPSQVPRVAMRALRVPSMIQEEVSRLRASSAYRKAAEAESGSVFAKGSTPASQTQFELAWLQWEQEALIRDKQLRPDGRVANIMTQMNRYYIALTVLFPDQNVTLTGRSDETLRQAEEDLRATLVATYG